jgi:hypothetical protein
MAELEEKFTQFQERRPDIAESSFRTDVIYLHN